MDIEQKTINLSKFRIKDSTKTREMSREEILNIGKNQDNFGYLMYYLYDSKSERYSAKLIKFGDEKYDKS